MKNLRFLSLLSALLLGLEACNRLDINPRDTPSDETFWNSTADALNVLSSCYENMYNAEYFFFNETLSDNAFNKSEVDGSNSRNIAQGSYDASQRRITSEWGYHYTGIRKCNLLLGNVDRVPGMDETLRNRIKGEARFIRAWHYFHLSSWYGDVPLVENEIGLDESKAIGRTAKAQLLDFIVKELDFAAANLPTNAQYEAKDKGRITRGAALALKARTYLQEGRWAEVAAACEQIVGKADAGTYALFNSYAGVFSPQNENNNEVMLDIQYVFPQRTYAIQRLFIPLTEGRQVCSIAPSQELVDDYVTLNGRGIAEGGSGYDATKPYENRDPRFGATVVYNGYQWRRPNGETVTINTFPGTGENSVDNAAASPTGYYVAKYFDPTADGNLNSGLNLILIRYADVLLMHAEAKNELGQLDAATWNLTIGALRRRAGFTDAAALAYPAAASQAALRTIIRRERRAELAMEGLRIFDIRRWKTAEQVLNGKVTGIPVNNTPITVDTRTFDPAKHYLWPVPQRERDFNPTLGQNPGW